ncbi:MAG TPA: T9SS type A sorting domain-containing protein, partial [Bacteroidia bacterium]|nr:T9SS type A sorting domain-containing protein [Bacteroidia bacterium]
PYCYSYRDRIAGDTLIGIHTYKKITQTFSFHYNYNGVTGYYTGDSLYHIYKGAVRQDTLANKVFLCLPGHSADTLLYSYNLSVGDTFPKSYLCPFPHNQPLVKKIDTVVIGSVHYRRLLLDTAAIHSSFPQVIQGIGSTQGFLTPFYSFFEQGPCLECFNKNNTPAYMGGPFANECSSSFSTGIREEQMLSFTLSPNPSAGGLFTLSLPENNEVILEVYTLLGEKISSMRTTQSSIQLNLSAQPKGIYIYRLVSENRLTASGKLVIQ